MKKDDKRKAKQFQNKYALNVEDTFKTVIFGLLRRKKEYEKIGLCCPSSTCDYIEKNLVNLTEKNESMNEFEND